MTNSIISVLSNGSLNRNSPRGLAKQREIPSSRLYWVKNTGPSLLVSRVALIHGERAATAVAAAERRLQCSFFFATLTEFNFVHILSIHRHTARACSLHKRMQIARRERTGSQTNLYYKLARLRPLLSALLSLGGHNRARISKDVKSTGR